MALFDQYTQPGVYTSEQVANPGTSLQTDLRIPIFIGEGEENRVYQNIEFHRGSSSVADDLVVAENLSHQIDGVGRTFQLGYWPVVVGDGNGTVTSAPTAISATINGIPATVSSLTGATGSFMLSQIPLVGDSLEVSYFFKKTDTLITDDLTTQVPVFASLTRPEMTLTVSQPGELGNLVSVAFTSSATGVEDLYAVTGSGSDTISIEVKKADGTLRTWGQVRNLITLQGGIPTLNSGLLVVGTFNATYEASPASAAAAAFLINGAGPSTNLTFKVKYVPIVDGSNGGVVTNSTSFVRAFVNNVPATLASVDGLHGMVTLASAVPAGSSLSVTYYTNTYQDTFDLLPANNIVAIDQVGFGPNRTDFINGVDYVLENVTAPDGSVASSRIQWGNSASVGIGTNTAGYTPFNGSVVTTTLVDEKMFLQKCVAPQGAVDGQNATYTLPDTPTDGSGQNKGLGKATDDPDLIQVYVGAGASDDLALTAALLAGPVRVTQLVGATGTFKLYSAPPAGSKVFATYNRNTLNDHTYTLSVVTPGITGIGTFTMVDENNNPLPTVAFDSASSTVADAGFTTSGIVWPFAFPDISGVPGVTTSGELLLTFKADGTPGIVVGTPVAASASIQGMVFAATTPNSAANGISISFVSGPGVADTTAAAVTVSGTDIFVNITKLDNSSRTLAEIATLFASPVTVTIGSYTTAIDYVSGTAATTAIVVGPSLFSGGDAGSAISVSKTYEVSYKELPSSTPLVLGTGYLNQTFVSADFGVKFTVINPEDATTLGFTTPVPKYYYAVGDVVSFKIGTEHFTTSASPKVAIPGLWTTVTTTYGMKAQDTAIVQTFNKSGNEPAIGDYYYVTYTTAKTDAELGLIIFTNPSDAYLQYGDPTPINRLSLAASLFTQNGGQTFGCLQVRKDVGLDTASDNTYKTAIASLASPIPGSERKADMIQVMTTSAPVLQYLNRFVITQAAPRNSGEATAVYGYGFTAVPDTMRSLARSLRSERMIGLSVPGAVLSATTNGSTVEYAVDGSFLAAAMAGMMLNPAIDTAATLTRQSMVGFTRLIKRYDDPTMDLMAADGLTCLIERDGAFVVRHWVTTDNTSVLKREPTSRLVIDEVRRTVRKNLEQFIGRKLVQSAINSVTVVSASTLKGMVDREIIEGFKNLIVQKDASDPTVLHVAFSVKPMFSLLYVDVQITVTTQL